MEKIFLIFLSLSLFTNNLFGQDIDKMSAEKIIEESVDRLWGPYKGWTEEGTISIVFEKNNIKSFEIKRYVRMLEKETKIRIDISDGNKVLISCSNDGINIWVKLPGSEKVRRFNTNFSNYFGTTSITYEDVWRFLGVGENSKNFDYKIFSQTNEIICIKAESKIESGYDSRLISITKKDFSVQKIQYFLNGEIIKDQENEIQIKDKHWTITNSTIFDLKEKKRTKISITKKDFSVKGNVFKKENL